MCQMFNLIKEERMYLYLHLSIDGAFPELQVDISKATNVPSEMSANNKLDGPFAL